MAAAPKTVLFLCTGNYYRSRYAEILFNATAGRMNLLWRATSRALALERGTNNVGPMAKSVLTALERQSIRDLLATSRLPLAAVVRDFDRADRVVALKDAEHRPLLETRFAAQIEGVEYWDVNDDPTALETIEGEVNGLIARIVGGGERVATASPPTAPQSFAIEKSKPKPTPKAVTVRVGRETKGRRGKGVTIVWDVPGTDAALHDLAATLKNRCGTGGTVKDRTVEIQGDQRDRVGAVLEEMGYRVKRVGG